jgi:hypothetical protein
MKRFVELRNTIVIILYALSLYGCAGLNKSTSALIPTKELVMTPLTPSITLTTSVTATRAKPSVTTTITSLPIPTYTPTLTKPPTLTSTERDDALLQLLATANDCNAPCLFGIVPGKTTIDELENHFYTTFGEGLTTKDVNGRIQSYAISFNLADHLLNSTEFRIRSGVVYQIDTLLDHLFDPAVKPEEWSAFSLRNILESYGMPSRVEFYLDTPHEPVSNPGVIYSYTLFFSTSDTIVTYYGGQKENIAILRICLLEEQPTHMEMHIAWQPYIEGSDDGVTLENATSLSIQGFYNLMMNDPHGCIDLKTDAFNK